MFLHVSVILFTGGFSGEPPLPPGTRQTASPGPGRPPGTKENPPGTRQTPPRDQGEPPRDQADTHPPPGPRRTTPRDQAGRTPRTKETPPRQTPPRQGDPPREEGCSIRSMSGRYASYWNAFLLGILFHGLNLPLEIKGLNGPVDQALTEISTPKYQ